MYQVSRHYLLYNIQLRRSYGESELKICRVDGPEIKQSSAHLQYRSCAM